METTLSIRLREGTKESHRLAEQTPFIRSFFEGRLTKEIYREFLIQLLHIYEALEDSQRRHRAHETFGKICFPSLFRGEALRRDLNFYFGDDRWKETPPLRAAETYIQRINSLSNEWVEGLVAHHYTRYLGDLSGGQALKRIVAKTFRLSSSDGLAFYDFAQIENHSQFKNGYRAALDSMPLDDETIQKIIDEANLAFRLNRDVFASMTNLAESN
ncbi:MAG: biliverdin-producing heme oxygenase [Chloroflexi bacterium]|nr:biliverdin-producing heme oxygenase [Chloroflexota bacterium]